MNRFTIFALIISFAFSSFAGDYPKTKLDREMDEMGSLAGGEGVVFRPGKEKSTDSRAVVGNVNKYLYQASLDVLKFAPIISADSSSGAVITDWYSPKDQKNVRFKITVYIKDTVISPEGVEVVALQKKKHNGVWPENYEVSPVGAVFEDKILRKARELYQQSKK